MTLPLVALTGYLVAAAAQLAANDGRQKYLLLVLNSYFNFDASFRF